MNREAGDQGFNLVYVDIKRRKNVAAVTRGQTWYWESRNGLNNKVIGRSKGFHTNRDDLIDNIDLHFGSEENPLLSNDNTWVYRREAEHGNVLIRRGTSQTQPKTITL